MKTAGILQRLNDIELALGLGNDLQGVTYEDVSWLCQTVRRLFDVAEAARDLVDDVIPGVDWPEFECLRQALAALEEDDGQD